MKAAAKLAAIALTAILVVAGFLAFFVGHVDPDTRLLYDGLGREIGSSWTLSWLLRWGSNAVLFFGGGALASFLWDYSQRA